jgi:hypothetical protein
MRLKVVSGRRVLESHTVPDGSWVRTEHMGMQVAAAVLERIGRLRLAPG